MKNTSIIICLSILVFSALTERGFGNSPKAKVEEALLLLAQEQMPDQDIQVILDQPLTELRESSQWNILNFDPTSQSNRFKATLTVTDLGTEINLSGKITKTMEVPVLKKSLNRGEILQEEDIEFKKIPINHVSRAVITDPNDLIGFAVRTSQLQAFKPIVSHQIHAPVLVTKGATVTMHLETPNMQITTHGKALENGGLGDTVRVLNPTSKKIVLGTIAGPNQVTMAIPTLIE